MHVCTREPVDVCVCVCVYAGTWAWGLACNPVPPERSADSLLRTRTAVSQSLQEGQQTLSYAQGQQPPTAVASTADATVTGLL